MKKITLFAIAMITAASTFGAVIEMGTRELMLNGNLDFDNPNGNVEWNLDAGMGYFVMDDIEVGPMVGLAYNGDDMGYAIGAMGEYNLDLEMAVVPYAAVRALYRWGDFYAENHLVGEGALGVKVFLSESVAVAGEVFYDYASEEIFTNNGKLESDNAGLTLGVRCFF